MFPFLRPLLSFTLLLLVALHTPSFGAEAHEEKLQFGHEHDLAAPEGPLHFLQSASHRLERCEEDGYVRLFDLAKDPSGKTNIANQISPTTSRLLARLKERFNISADPAPRAQPLDSAAGLPPHVIRPSEAGPILLHARDAEIHGSTVRYEPQTNKNTIGYWSRASDWVSWDFYVAKPGAYTVEILQGCGPRSGGSLVGFHCNQQKLEVTVQETKHFQDFIAREIGRFEFKEPGRYTLSVKPETKPGAAVMDLRLVTLKPAR